MATPSPAARARIGVLVSMTLGLLAAATPAPGEVTTFGYSNARLGATDDPVGIGPAGARRLQVAWRSNVGGAITGQPLVADDVRWGAGRRDVVLVATENGQVVALDRRSGRLLWRRGVGSRRILPDCQSSPDGRFGVTATMVIDRRSGAVFAADARGRLWALDLRTGQVLRGWPVEVDRNGSDFIWGALGLSRGRLYVPIASLCDGGRYQGGVVSVDLTHAKRLKTWDTVTEPGDYAGGIWGWGGVSIDARSGDVYAATGNSLGRDGEAAPDSERVVRLSAGLAPLQVDYPLRPPFGVGDRDFGTTPVLLQAPGCPLQAVAINKLGNLYLYDRDQISAGPVQTIAVAAPSPTGILLYGMPAYDPATRTLVLVSPTAPPDSSLRAGLQAFVLTAACRLSLRWQQPQFDYPYAGSAPTVAGGVVYVGAGRDGRFLAYRLSDGRPLWAHRLSSQATLAAPSVDRGTVLVGDWSGHLSALRPGH